MPNYSRLQKLIDARRGKPGAPVTSDRKEPMPHVTTLRNIRSVAKKHGLDASLTINPRTCDVYKSGGSITHPLGGIYVKGDGSWEHGTGSGKGAEALDLYLSKLRHG